MDRLAAIWLSGALLVANVGSQQRPQQPLPPAPRVQLHFQDPYFQSQADAAVAEVWQLAGLFVDLESIERRLVVHVYNDLVSCQKVADRFDVGWSRGFPGVVAPGANSVHVTFYRCGWCRDARWRVGNLTMRMVLRAAAALPEKQWPWIVSEGLTRYAEGAPTNKDGWWVEPRKHGSRRPDSRFLVKHMVQERSLPRFSDSRLVGLRDYEREDVSRQRVLFLMQRHADAARLALRAALATKVREQAEATFLQTLREQLGEQAFADLDADFRAYVEGLTDLRETEFYPHPDGVGVMGAQDHVPPSPSILWLDQNRRARFQVTAKVRLLQSGQADLAFERRGGAWVRVTIEGSADRGYVSVWQRRMKKGRPDGWTRLATTTQDVAAVRLRREVDLEVVVNGRQLTIATNGEQVLRGALPEGNLAGRYGVGGPFANQVSWRRIRLR